MRPDDQSETPGKGESEARALRRWGIINAVRLGALGVFIAGLAAVRDVIDLPAWLGVVLTVGGMVGFFFAPTLMARRFKAQDRIEER